KNRGSAHFLNRNWTDALVDFRRRLELSQQKQDYPRFFIWLIRTRLGEKAAANKELVAYLDKRWNGAPDDWATKVANFLLDKISEADFFAAAASPDAKKERSQRCEAWFYAGMKRLLNVDKTTAADYFRKCLATEEKDFTEYQFAKAELHALGK